MSELPEGWIGTTLGQTCSKPQYGWTSKANTHGRIKYVRTTDISHGQINWDEVPYCELEPNVVDKFRVHEDDILVSRAGSVGVSFRIKDVPCDAVFASYLIRFNPLECVLPKYVEYFLNSHDYWRAISEFSAGIAVPNVNASKLAELEIPLPPLNEQRRIVAKLEKLLSCVDAAQARLATIPRILKRFRQSVLATACSGKLTNDWREANSDIEYGNQLVSRIRKSILDRYHHECATAIRNGSRKPRAPSVLLDLKPDPTQLPDLPDTWSWSYLQNVGEFTRGKSKHRPRNDPKLFDGPYPFIQTGDVARSNGRISDHSQTYNEVGLAQSRLFPTGTLCVTIAANIAETALLTYPACFPDSVVGFIPEEALFEALWAMYFLRVVQSDLETFAPATAQKNINMDILFKVAVPVPPLAEQREIVRRVEALFQTADALEARYSKAKAHVDKLTQSILAKAFRGELVPQDPNDEPASVLLARVQQGRTGKQSEQPQNKSNRSRMKKAASHVGH